VLCTDYFTNVKNLRGDDEASQDEMLGRSQGERRRRRKKETERKKEKEGVLYLSESSVRYLPGDTLSTVPVPVPVPVYQFVGTT
jgi:hypothetical protein